MSFINDNNPAAINRRSWNWRIGDEDAAPPVVPSYSSFFGETLNGSATDPLHVYPAASNAEIMFLAQFASYASQDFESYAGGETAPLVFVLSPGGTPVTCTFTGTGSVGTNPPDVAVAGRYSVPTFPVATVRYWRAPTDTATNLCQIEFSTPINGFGFYGIDVGDFGGQLFMEILDASDNILSTVTIPNTEGAPPDFNIDGSVLYYGIVADNSASSFSKVRLFTTYLGGDIFAFDLMTIALA